jgi:ADP-heptose:LPS heptosyltransferase
MTEEQQFFKRAGFLKFVRQRANVRRILIIRNGLLGDIVSITSVIRRLSNTYPDVVIDAVVGPQAVPVLKYFKNIRNIYAFNFTYNFLSVLKQVVFFLGLGKNRYDVVLVQEVNTHFTIMGKLVRGKYMAGFTNTYSGMYDYHIVRPKQKMVLAETATVKEWTDNCIDRAELAIIGEEVVAISALLKNVGHAPRKKMAIIHYGSSNPNSDRQWVLERFSGVADHIIERHDYEVVFTGIESDAANVAFIQSKMKNASISLAGKTSVREFMALIKMSQLVIAPDTGAVHISTALDIPTIILIGLSDPDDTGAYNPEDIVRVVRAGIACAPCVYTVPKPEQWKYCETARPTKCMDMITVEMVNEAVDALLGKKLNP